SLALLAMTVRIYVIANEVKQSQYYRGGDCFVAGASGNDGEDICHCERSEAISILQRRGLLRRWRFWQ
ncbi:MAG: hypothetical protein WHS77_11065, partial [Brevinematales bacterium]